MMHKCRICEKPSVEVVLDCGYQPLCNRFVENIEEDEYQYPLVLGQCQACGLLQLTETVPAEEISPRFDWITYNEPEAHLDDLVAIISALPEIGEESVICGVTSKDDSTLERIEGKRIGRTWRIDPINDLGIEVSRPGWETIQTYLTVDTAMRLCEKHGHADVVIARHVFEHSVDPLKVLESLKNLLSPNGYIVFEVPDCARSLENQDYTMLWEEHVLYFTPDTLLNSLEFVGLSLVHTECYSYPIENALIAIVQVDDGTSQASVDSKTLPRELERGNSYGEGFGEHSVKLRRFVEKHRETCGRIAVFGAGHLACTFVNLMEIKDYLELVVDDHPNKQGLYMPGSHLPIRGSHSLIDVEISLCLLSLSPESEVKVIEKNKRYIESGGEFVSIFAANQNHLLL